MRYSLFGLSLTLILIIVSCGGDTSGEVTKKEEKCLYSFDQSATNLVWTAYKTEGKVPVEGGFNDIQVKSEAAYSQKEVIESIEFTIKTNSIHTIQRSNPGVDNPERNAKIDSLFFGFRNITELKGKVRKLEDNGKAVMTFSIGGIDYDIEGDYTLDGNKFTFDCEMKFINWNLEGAADNLNDACLELHRGAEGEESKLWQHVNISLSTELSTTCN